MSKKQITELDKISIMFEMVYGITVFSIGLHKNGWMLRIPAVSEITMIHWENTLPVLGYKLASYGKDETLIPKSYNDAGHFITISRGATS